MKVTLIFLTLLTISCAHNNNQSDRIIASKISKRNKLIYDWLNLPFDRGNVITQGENTYDCGPAAIFNSHKLGKVEMKDVIKSFNGSTLHKKFQDFWHKISQKPSEQFKGAYPRTRRHSGGTWPGDIRFMLVDLFSNSNLISPVFRGDYLERKDGEQSLLTRVHSDLSNSISNGVPPVILWSNYYSRRRDYGHYVTVIGVSSIETNNDDINFLLKYFDPLEGKVIMVKIVEPTESYLAHTWKIYGKPGEIVNPQIMENQSNASPFLRVYSLEKTTRFERPFTETETGDYNYTVLEQGYGDFSKMFDANL